MQRTTFALLASYHVSNPHIWRDGLTVAIESWEQFPALLQCGHASPASKRLALSLLFAALVIRPDIGLCDPWNEAE